MPFSDKATETGYRPTPQYIHSSLVPTVSHGSMQRAHSSGVSPSCRSVHGPLRKSKENIMTRRRTEDVIVRQGPLAVSHLRAQFMLVCAIFIISVSETEARVETPEEANKILAFLEAENCQIIRSAMGETKIIVTKTGFLVEARCADGKPYNFTLDRNFKLIDKEPRPY
jgi:hypothetical protein